MEHHAKNECAVSKNGIEILVNMWVRLVGLFIRLLTSDAAPTARERDT